LVIQMGQSWNQLVKEMQEWEVFGKSLYKLQNS